MKRVLYLAFVAVLAFATLGWTDEGVPAYHPAPPPKGAKLPAILPADALWGPEFQYPYQTHAYALAAKIPNVLYQQPCYCHCDRSAGHKSLRSCFEDAHGAECGTCLRELYYAYQQTKAGKTPKQIRAGIIRGDWQKIDLQTAASMQ
jgi:hypothetical protein